jgi:hypothetical protein
MSNRVPRWAQKESTRESDIEQYLVRRVKEIGGKTYKWVSPAQRSVPDRLVMHEKFHGRTLFVELKAPGKTPTPAQTAMIDGLIGMGHAVFVLDSKAMVDEFIEDVCELYRIDAERPAK